MKLYKFLFADAKGPIPSRYGVFEKHIRFNFLSKVVDYFPIVNITFALSTSGGQNFKDLTARGKNGKKQLFSSDICSNSQKILQLRK